MEKSKTIEERRAEALKQIRADNHTDSENSNEGLINLNEPGDGLVWLEHSINRKDNDDSGK